MKLFMTFYYYKIQKSDCLSLDVSQNKLYLINEIFICYDNFVNRLICYYRRKKGTETEEGCDITHIFSISYLREVAVTTSVH
jgi:hypothetical protein